MDVQWLFVYDAVSQRPYGEKVFQKSRRLF